jgi:hypothetical protein
MPTECHAVTQRLLETLVVWSRCGETTVPEMLWPFSRCATTVRDLLELLFKRIAVGYVITWKNPDPGLKDGTSSAAQRISMGGSTACDRVHG